MSTDATRLIAAMLAQRKAWVEVAPGKKLQVMRPPETALGDINAAAISGDVALTLAQVTKYTVGWNGVTEADLLGAAHGSSIEVEFDAEIWSVVAPDEPQWCSAAFLKIQELLVERFKARSTTAKN